MPAVARERYHRYRRYVGGLRSLYEKKQARVYSSIVASILAVTFFIFFAIRPTFVTIAKLLKEIEDKRIVAEKLEDKIQALNLAQAEYQRLEKQLFLINEALPEKSNPSLLIKQIETTVRKNQVEFVSFQVKGTPLKKAIPEGEANKEGQKVAFNLIVKGEYPQLKAFFDNLSFLRRLIYIAPVDFKANPKKGSISLQLEGEAYYLAPPKQEMIIENGSKEN
jgi:Tfp pilus assembly protein PilO